jgi:hypothetical protein
MTRLCEHKDQPASSLFIPTLPASIHEWCLWRFDCGGRASIRCSYRASLLYFSPGRFSVILNCARRNIPFQIVHFSLSEEHPCWWHCGLSNEGFPIFIVSNHRFRGAARLPFTARIGRPLLYRGGSASKKGARPLLPHPSEGARSRKHRTNTPCIPLDNVL